MSPLARAATCAALVFAVALIPALAAGEDHAPGQALAPLRNEDVVRMLVAGRPPAEVIAAIRSAEVSFDLSDEMAQELRLARVPADVLSAMAKRQAAVDRARAAVKPPDAVPESPAEGKTILVVTLRSGAERGEPKDLLYPARLGDDDARALQSGASDEEREVTDLAVFLACRTPDHVPDAWRSRSPLGGDFVSVARHRILAFLPGASHVPASKAPAGWRRPAPRGGETAADLLVLALPVELRAEVEPGVAHDLVVGVAIRAGDRYLEIAEARKDAVVPGPGGLSLAAVLVEHGGKGSMKVDVRFEGEAATGAPPR